MKNTLFILYAIFFSHATFGQAFCVSNNDFNIAIFGEQNLLTILVQGYDCDRITVTTDNGSISRSEYSRDCQFVFFPLKLGNATIHIGVKTKHGIKHIGDKIISVKHGLQFEANLRGRKNGSIYKAELESCIAPLAMVTNSSIDAKAVIKEFIVHIVRNEEILFSEKCVSDKYGARFTKELIERFSETRSDDVIFITGIKAVFFDKKPFLLNDIRLTVVE